MPWTAPRDGLKILVFAHRLEIGGTQVNAIELATYLRDRRGHDVAIVATPGPMVELVDHHAFRFYPAHDAARHPSLGRARSLARAIEAERPDVLHIWDAPQYLDAFGVACLARRLPTLVTSMSMTVERLLPIRLPVTFGTPDLVEQSRAWGRSGSELLLPPVDIDANAPGAVSGEPFRKRHRVWPNEILVVTVSRLVSWMKAESIRDTIEAVSRLAKEYPIRFAIVGDGTSRGELQTLADEVNARSGAPLVLLTGPAVDPREAYAAADIVVGMGGSSLRALAFGKPLVVAGEKGFSLSFTPETEAYFYRAGMYGVGDGQGGPERMTAHLRDMIVRRGSRSLSEFGRSFVLCHFSVKAVGDSLDRILRETAANRSPPRDLAYEIVRLAGLLSLRNLFRKDLKERLKRIPCTSRNRLTFASCR